MAPAASGGNVPVPTMIYDLPTVYDFLKSVAVARTLVELTRSHYDMYQESVALNTLYNVMGTVTFGHYAGPGFQEIDYPTKRRLLEESDLKVRKYLGCWIDAVGTGGGQGSKRYLEELQKCRSRDLDNIASMAQDQLKVNQEVLDGLKYGARAMAITAAAGTIAVAWIGVAVALGITIVPVGVYGGIAYTGVGATVGNGMAAIIATGIGTARGVACSLIKDWREADGAEAVGVSQEWKTEAKQGGAELVLHRAGDKATEVLAERAETKAKVVEELEKRMAKLNEDVVARIQRYGNVGRSRSVAAAKASRSFQVADGELAAAKQTTKTAGNLTRAVPVVFATIDTGKALWDLKSVFDDTK